MANSKEWGTVRCPNCYLEVCIHEEGWHIDDEPENDNFDELSEFVKTHQASHEE